MGRNGFSFLLFKKTGAWFCGLTQSYVDEVFAGFEGQFMDFDGVFPIGFGNKIECIAGPLSDQIGSSGIADDDYRIEFRVDAPCRTLDDVALSLNGFE